MDNCIWFLSSCNIHIECYTLTLILPWIIIVYGVYRHVIFHIACYISISIFYLCTWIYLINNYYYSAACPCNLFDVILPYRTTRVFCHPYRKFRLLISPLCLIFACYCTCRWRIYSIYRTYQTQEERTCSLSRRTNYQTQHLGAIVPRFKGELFLDFVPNNLFLGCKKNILSPCRRRPRSWWSGYSSLT